MPSLYELLRSRVLSSIVAITGIVAAFIVTGNAAGSLILVAGLILPLACIWYADELGTRTGITTSLTGPRISQSTPGIAVAAGGWILMLSVLIVAFLFSR